MPLQMYEDKKQSSPNKIKHILAVAAGKGGVGKSTVAVNLARAFKQLGFTVGLMDTDVYGPSVRKMLPEDRMPSQKEELIVPALCEGIRMISMAYFRKDDEAAVVRAPIANGIVTQFISNVQWGDLDYLLIDFPPGTGDVQLTLSQKANLTGAVMVTTPQEIAMMDVRKAMNMFSIVKVPIVGVIENMSGYYHPETKETIYLFGRGGGERLALEAGVPFLGPIPIDPELSLRSDQGRTIFNSVEGSVCSSADPFLQIAKTVHSQVESLDGNWKESLGAFEIHWKEMN
jgi:ATP-binding protein involved in chromosome partitioning